MDDRVDNSGREAIHISLCLALGNAIIERWFGKGGAFWTGRLILAGLGI